MDRARIAGPLDHPHPGDDRGLDPRPDARVQRRRLGPGLVSCQARASWSLLSAYQGWLGAYGKKLARGERPLSSKAVRMINEIPGVAAAIIVVLVIVRPF